MLKCRNCDFNNPDGMNYCGKCGHPLQPGSVTRPADDPASARLPAYAHRQPRDYTPEFLLESVLRSRHAMAGENKRVAVLFADVVGFTQLAEKLDPENLHQLMSGCFEILGEVVHGAGGTINQYTGDGIMAIFGAPIALEDYTAKACFAALEIQRRLISYNADVSRKVGIDFKMRIGLNIGQVLVGAIGDNLRLDYTAIGDTTNLAARLEASAAPGAIHVSERVAESAAHRFHFEDMGTRRIKGKSLPQRIFRLVAEKSEPALALDATATQGALMGRENELTRLKEAWRLAQDDGPIAVALLGSAGIGKKRLLTHFLSTTIKKHAFVITGRCQPEGQSTALQFLFELFAKTFFSLNVSGLNPEKPMLDLAEKSDQLLNTFNRIRKQIAHRDTLFEGRKRKLFSGLRDLIDSATRIRPCVIAINDCQWLDPLSHAFLSDLAVSTPNRPVLIICLGRGFKDHPYVQASRLILKLGPLDAQTAFNLFAGAMGARRIDPLLKRMVLDRAGGNPLFLIELAESLRRNNQVIIEKDCAVLKSPMVQLKLPAGIYDVLAARLDALPENDKQLLQVASVAGTGFSRHLLEKAIDVPTDLNRRLEALENASMIEKISSNQGGEYRFRQQMMRDIAYEMMLRSTRKQLHQKIGQALEAFHRDRLTDVMGQLAYHFYMADQWSKALAYNLEAGHQARRIFACHTALVCFDRVQNILITHQPEDYSAMLVGVLNWKGLMHYCAGQFGAALESFKSMRAEARRISSPSMEAEGLFRIGWINFFLHKPRSALDYLSSARKMAKNSDLPDILLKATSFLGSLHLVLGRFQAARQLLIEALNLSDDTLAVEPKAWTLSSLIRHYNWVGEYEEALRICEELETINRRLQSRYFENFLYFHKGLIHTALGQWQQAGTILQDGVDQLEPGDELFWRPRMRNTLGWLLAMQKAPDRALSINKRALSEALESEDPETVYNARINIAENYLQLGDLTRGGNEITAIWHQIRYKREVYTIWRVKTRARLAMARYLLATGNPRQARQHVKHAYQAAVKTGARKHQAMALKIHAQILRKTRPRVARRLLDQGAALAVKMRAPWLIADIDAQRKW